VTSICDNNWSAWSIRTGNRSAMPDNPPIPADGRAMAKADGNSIVHPPVNASTHIGHDKVPSGSKGAHLLKSYSTDPLGEITNIVVCGVSHVKRHVN
jgi:hypothetical protein